MSLAQLSRLLPLPDTELQQVLDYALTLSKSEAAEHFNNLLGDSPQAVEFISSFNSRRHDPATVSANSSNPSSEIDAVPKSHRHAKKKKLPLHTPAPRQIVPAGPVLGTTYSKKDLEEDYISGRSGTSTPSSKHAAQSNPPPAAVSAPGTSKPKLSSAGILTSDLLAPKTKPRSNPASRSSTPGPGPKTSTASTKISITGGTPMHGASTALSDLDAAIRSLEITTNPSLSNSPADIATRRCNCVATRHPLQTAAPNCLNCGKVICVKEGLGPCTFCGTPLLSAGEVQAMIKELRAERGRERMAADRDAHRRADVAGTPRPFTKPRDGPEGVDLAAAEAQAREHRDRLLGFQAQNARRTTVRDEVADFDIPTAANLWASPEERARELKRQQKLLREMEWNARPDYDKRRQVVSIDLVGGRVVKKMAAIDRPPSPEDEGDDAAEATDAKRVTSGSGAFSRNPLLGGMIKPVYDTKGKATDLQGRKSKNTQWRRVQDDLGDNEAVLLDGGVHGGLAGADVDDLLAGAGDEPGCG